MKPISMTIIAVLLLTLLLPTAMPSLTGLTSDAYAAELSDADKAIFDLSLEELIKIEVVSATRGVKSISKVAENMVVIRAADIELMSAHTLADVVNTVNSMLTVTGKSSPGNVNTVFIQGGDNRHTAVFMDGIPLNNLSNFSAEIGSIPVQQIKKIEIIKGPASSVWGSSLGGVINIITKSPSDMVSGTLSASYGEKNTGDFRTEVSGTKDRFGYYLSAGRLQTDGLRPMNDADQNSIYTKFSLRLGEDTSLLYTLFYTGTKRGTWQDVLYDSYGRGKDKTLLSSLSLNSVLTNNLSLNMSLHASMLDYKVFNYLISDNSETFKSLNRENAYGGSAKLTWTGDVHNIVAGSDFDEGSYKSDLITDNKQKQTRWSVYANDTVTLGKFSITPGLRYDNIESNGSAVSSSLGITYAVLNKTVLRAGFAQGFNTPPLLYTYGYNMPGFRNNPDLTVEKVTSYGSGIETGLLEYVWLKISAFRHDLSGGILPDTDPISGDNIFVNKSKIRRQGVEAEAKTIPFYNTSFFVGAMTLSVKDRETGESIPDMPKRSVHAGVHYDDKKSFKAIIQGSYIDYNSEDLHLAEYNSFVVDANLIKTIYAEKNNRVELFLTAHNIFNGSQYWDYLYVNPARWVEGGVRYKF
jgi:vitamin B12 transporter